METTNLNKTTPKELLLYFQQKMNTNPIHIAIVDDDTLIVKDANGTLLQDGDDVTVIKDLKVKGSSSGIKVGTKIKGIRLVDGNDGHNIDCKVPGVGAIKLKQEFVKKQ